MRLRQLSRLSLGLAFPLWIIFRSVRDPDNPAAQTTSVRTGSFPSFCGGTVLILLSVQKCVGLEGREPGELP